jgi:hypothetical protein
MRRAKAGRGLAHGPVNARDEFVRAVERSVVNNML